jgi:c-di-AMP phosphodiesterase-like protein
MRILTDTEILQEVKHQMDNNETIDDIKCFINNMERNRQSFITIQEAILETDRCLQLIIERASKYGEAWRDTRISSLTDYVIMKYHRVNKLIDNPIENYSKIESDLQDMINYGLFCLIKLHDEQHKNQNNIKDVKK